MQNLGIVLDPDDQLDFDRYCAMDQLGAKSFDAAREDGRRLSLDQALSLGLGRR